MLVKGMNTDEIFNELFKDFTDFIKDSMIADLSKKYYKFAIKSNNNIFPYKCKAFSFVTKSKNKWNMINMISHKRSKCFHSLCYCSRVLDGGGIEAYKFNGKLIYEDGMIKKDSIIGIQIFTPHLFQRYRERNNLNISGFALIEKFFDDNCALFQSAYSFYEGELETSCICKGGILLGCYTDSTKTNILYKTYISENEMNEEQYIRYSTIKDALTVNLESIINEVLKNSLNSGMSKLEVQKKLKNFDFIASTNTLPMIVEKYGWVRK